MIRNQIIFSLFFFKAFFRNRGPRKMVYFFEVMFDSLRQIAQSGKTQSLAYNVNPRMSLGTQGLAKLQFDTKLESVLKPREFFCHIVAEISHVCRQQLTRTLTVERNHFHLIKRGEKRLGYAQLNRIHREKYLFL